MIKSRGIVFCSVFQKLMVLLLVLLISPAFASFVPNKVIVKFKSPYISVSQQGIVSSSSPSIQEKLANIGIKSGKKVFSDDKVSSINAQSVSSTTFETIDLSETYLFNLVDGSDVIGAVNNLKQLPEVEYAEPDYILKAFLAPNDPGFVNQWNLKKISAEAGWDLHTGLTGVATIAVVDTGILYSHEDLIGKVDADNSWNFVSSESDANDDNGHGTHCAGVAAALTDNAKGVAGINWGAKLLAIKVLGSDGFGDTANVAAGIVYAASRARVITMSFGDTHNSITIGNAVATAYSQGCILVAAAGNENTQTPLYPAAYDGVIAVAATDSNDLRSVWSDGQASNYGSWVDISAPGTNIYSTYIPGQNYQYESGTSMATPHVAGLASLIVSSDPAITNDEVRRRIEVSSDNIDSKNPAFVGLLGKGRINIARALGLPVVSILSPIESSYVSGIVSIVGTVSSLFFKNYSVQLGVNSPPIVFNTIFESTNEVSNGTLCTLDSTSVSDGSYSIKVSCSNSIPLTAETSVVLHIDNTPPIATISNYSDGDTISGTATIKGTVYDSNFASYSLEYARGSDFHTIASSTSIPSGQVLGIWNTWGLSGPYKLRVTATDLAGHSASQTINVIVSPEVGANFLVSVPDSCVSGINFPVRITGRHADGATAEVLDTTTLTVDAGLITPETIAPSLFVSGVWNGNLNLNILGTRTITARNGLASGSAAILVTNATQEYLFPGIPGMSVSMPAGATSMEISVTATKITDPSKGSRPQGFSLGDDIFEIGPTGTRFLFPITVTIPISGPLIDPHIYYWNGTSWSADGVSLVRYTSSTLTFSTTHFSAFAAMTAASSNIVRFAPSPFNPNSGDGRFWYWLNANSDISIYLMDISGVLVWKKYFSSGENGGLAGANTILFDGKTSWGELLGNGVYLYKIVQNGKSIGGGKVAIIK